jgi:hypothetical protein
MKRRNAIKIMLSSIFGGIAALLKPKTAQALEIKCRKTAHGEVYYIEFQPDQHEEAISKVKSLSNDLYARKLKSYSAKFSNEGHCVVEWSPNSYV